MAALLAALASALVIGLASTTLLWLLAETRRQAADETSREARAAIRENFTLATESPEFQRDGMQNAREILLDKALEYFRIFVSQRCADNALQAEFADAHFRVGYILNERVLWRMR